MFLPRASSSVFEVFRPATDCCDTLYTFLFLEGCCLFLDLINTSLIFIEGPLGAATPVLFRKVPFNLTRINLPSEDVNWHLPWSSGLLPRFSNAAERPRMFRFCCPF